MNNLRSLIFAFSTNTAQHNSTTYKNIIRSLKMTYEMATLGGGCFLVMEAVFQHLRGVKRTLTGYTGGAHEFPNFEDVLRGDTGHTCVVQVEYDTNIVNYANLLDVFFLIQSAQHSSLQLVSQNKGMQQQAARIFYHGPAQHKLALHTLARQQKIHGHLSQIQVVPAGEFYPSEDHLQSFYKLNRQNQYSLEVVAPKIQLARNFMKSQVAVSA
jgi:peptide-methionine (S)-S-oxide reductase